jgi:hypothetical protein
MGFNMDGKTVVECYYKNVHVSDDHVHLKLVLPECTGERTCTTWQYLITMGWTGRGSKWWCPPCSKHYKYDKDPKYKVTPEVIEFLCPEHQRSFRRAHQIGGDVPPRVDVQPSAHNAIALADGIAPPPPGLKLPGMGAGSSGSPPPPTHTSYDDRTLFCPCCYTPMQLSDEQIEKLCAMRKPCSDVRGRG